MSIIYPEILDPLRQQVFHKLKVFSSGYLVGGTALALQIKHRVSEDFDVFFPKPLYRPQLKKQSYSALGDFKITRDSGQHLILFSHQGIKLDLVYYTYPRISPLVKTDSIPLASLDDIAADKASAIGQRATWRDYVDIFWLLKHEYLTLKKIIINAQKKFKGEFNEVLFMEQLAYFKDLTMQEIKFIDTKYSESEIKNFLEIQVSQFLKQNLKI